MLHNEGLFRASLALADGAFCNIVTVKGLRHWHLMVIKIFIMKRRNKVWQFLQVQQLQL